MTATIKDLIENLALLPTTDAVRRKNNSYALNEAGDIIAISLSGSNVNTINLTKEALHLEHLYLNANKALATLHFYTALPHLQHLYIEGCALEELIIPAGCGALKQLYARNNQLKQMVFEGDCPALELLDLSDNQLRELSILKGFRQLKYLYLKNNKTLTKLDFVSPPRELEVLHLAFCALEALPHNLLSFISLQNLYLYENPLPSIPKASIKRGEEADSYQQIWDYLQEKSKGVRINDRVKIIIVGNGRVGKTSMFRRLKGLEFRKKEKYTHGIQLGDLDKDKLPGVKTPGLQANIWDFGGQEIFYATHQFFLTSDALYILAWTLEENVEEYRQEASQEMPEDDKFQTEDYWLENIRHHGGKNSPILMVQTQYDKQSKAINELYFLDKYGAKCLNFSADTMDGLGILRRYITQKLNEEISFFGQDFPVTYDKVIVAVEKLNPSKTKISRTYFDTVICKEAGIEQGGETSVLHFLRHTGTVVWFPEVSALKEVIYINPDWLTEQVYRLINNDLKSRAGRIDAKYIDNLLPEYTEIERKQFLKLLENFGLIFEPREEKDVFIAPQYLPDELGRDGRKLLKIVEKNLVLAFTFHFPRFLPDNVMINFLSKYGPFSENLYWKNGICFQNQLGQNCVVKLKDNSLEVLTEQGAVSFSLQAEICQAFVQLSKNANAEITFDGIRVSWQKLVGAMEDDIPKIRDCTGKAVPIHLFGRFFEKKEVLIKPSNELNKQQQLQNMTIQDLQNQVRTLISRARTKQAIELIESWAAEEGDKEAKDTIALIKLAWETLKREERMGFARNANQRSAETNYNLLNFEWSQKKEEVTIDETDRISKTSPVIYFSYAWGDEQEEGESRVEIVNDLYDSLIKEGFNIKRDNMNIKYTGLISEFMKQLGKGDLIVVFMSDKYLRSEYCMWELSEIFRNSQSEKEQFVERILPIRVQSIALHKPLVLRKYLSHWNDYYTEHQELIRDFPQQIGKPQLEAFEKIRTVKDKFGELVGYFQDMNANSKSLLRQDDFELIKRAIIEKSAKL